MNDHDLLMNAFIYLCAAVIVVPLAKRMGVGSVLGYLAAGIFIGPWGLKLIADGKAILHFAEFGVVLMLFLIGLELNPKRLWDMRKRIVGSGGFQVICTTLLLFSIALMFEPDWPVALVAALGMALSSTAIAIQLLEERNLISTPAGESGLSILLFQDIAVIPILALLPLIAVSDPNTQIGDPWLATLKIIAVVMIITVGGYYLTRPIFRYIAGSRIRELLTALSLLLVIGISILMKSVGLSMALGTFLAGVLLAESEYRHQLESDLEPFKGLLLGLFFISVGMSIDFGLLLNDPLLIIGFVCALVSVKFCVLMLLGKITNLPLNQNYLLAFLLSQGGEFAFVIFASASSYAIISTEDSAVLTVVVALSMLTTPLLMKLNSLWLQPKYLHDNESKQADKIDEQKPVIVAGFGRFGQIVARLLHAKKVPITIIDHNPEQIERVRQFGYKVYYGDATDMDLLESAGLSKARLLVVTIDDWNAVVNLTHQVKILHPELVLLLRSWDMVHAFQLMDNGASIVERDTFESALKLGERALIALGYDAYRSKRSVHKFRKHDETAMRRLYEVHKNESQLISRSVEAREDLERLFEVDEAALDKKNNDGWG